MILELNIRKLASGAYEAQCEGEVSESGIHHSIAALLAHYGTEIPAEFGQFVNVEYAGVRLATTSVASLATDSERHASELVQMVAEIYPA